MNDNIALKIKQFRKLRNMSQEDLAEKSGINVSTIKKYECGNRNPKPDQIKRIATALGVSINSLLSYEISSNNDILCLIAKLHQEANLQINGGKDENGKYIPESLKMSFPDKDMNTLIAKYMDIVESADDYPEEVIASGNGTDYICNVDGIFITIEKKQERKLKY